MMEFALAAVLAIGAAPPPAPRLGPQRAIAWTCTLLGPAGETHRVAGSFGAPDKITQGSFGSQARIAAVVDSDTTGLLGGRHKANASYAIPRSFNFGVVTGELITSFSMSYFGGGSGGLVTVTQTDAAKRAPTFARAIGTGYCRTVELAG